MADSPLQKAPSGLLGVFDLKTLGQSPIKFGDTVLPTFEVLSTYVPLTLNERTADVALGNTFVADTFDVPAGEIWIVRGLSYLAFPTAPDLAKSAWITFSVNNGIQQCVQTLVTSSGNPNQRSGQTLLSQPLWLRPGWGCLVRADWSAAAAAAIPGSISILYHRVVE